MSKQITVVLTVEDDAAFTLCDKLSKDMLLGGFDVYNVADGDYIGVMMDFITELDAEKDLDILCRLGTVFKNRIGVKSC